MFIGTGRSELARQNRITKEILEHYLQRRLFPQLARTRPPSVEEILPQPLSRGPEEPDGESLQSVESEQVSSVYQEGTSHSHLYLGIKIYICVRLIARLKSEKYNRMFANFIKKKESFRIRRLYFAYKELNVFRIRLAFFYGLSILKYSNEFDVNAAWRNCAFSDVLIQFILHVTINSVAEKVYSENSLLN